MRRASISITTDGSGDATGYIPATGSRSLSGRLNALVYTKTDYANGVDFTITVESTGQALVSATDANASATYTPRQATQSTAAAAALYAAGGTAVNDQIALVNDRIKIVVAQGGAAKVGTFTAILND